MKKTKIIYWILTILFAALIVFGAIPDALAVPDAVKFMNHLGYPIYFTHFIGVAKLLGAAAILIPGFYKIKEWAYAGLFFDLIGAAYSNAMVDGLQPALIIGMIVLFALGIGSYVFSKKVQASAALVKY